MNKRKFTLLILDDEDDEKQVGYFRIPNIILKDGFVDSKEIEGYKLAANFENYNPEIINDELTFNLIVLCGKHFLDMAQDFKGIFDSYKNLIEQNSTVDAFFIDLKWDMGKDKKTIEEYLLNTFFNDTNITTTNTEEPWKNKGGELPYTIAGVKFIQELPIDERPKIIFSGAEETKWFTWLFSTMGKRILSNDILIGELGSGEFTKEIVKTLEAYFHTKQVEVCRNLSYVKIQELIGQLDNNTNSDFDIFDIPDIENNDYYWSLRTLFPKELCESNTKTIIDIIEPDFKYFCKALYCHSATPLVEGVLKGLDYDLSDKVSTKGTYTTINSIGHKFPVVNWKLEINNITNSKLQGVKIIDTSQCGLNFKAYDFCKDGNTIDWKRETNKWGKIYGIYGIDIAYINEIIVNNFKKHINNNCTVSLGLIKENNKISFYWIVNLKAEKSHFNGLLDDIKRVNHNIISEKYRLTDNGIEDILKIVCIRYVGLFSFSSVNQELAVSFNKEQNRLNDKLLTNNRDCRNTIIKIEINKPNK